MFNRPDLKSGLKFSNMVYKKDRADIDASYMREGYRRLYWYAVDKNLYKTEYDRMIIESDLTGEKFLYEDFYCPSKLQTKILENLVDEEYITPRKVRHKIPEYSKRAVKASCTLGCSPFSCLSVFLNKHKETFKKIKQFLTQKDIEELDEY